MYIHAFKIFSLTVFNQVAIISFMYFTAIGYGMILAGIVINLVNQDETVDNIYIINDDLENSQNLLFSGGFIITLSCVSKLIGKHSYSLIACGVS